MNITIRPETDADHDSLRQVKAPSYDGVEEAAMQDEASYICDACGEEIVIPVDLSAGTDQEFVEDCPVCCRPNVVHVEIEEDGEARAWAEAEQDFQ